ncbi:hypothetical protein BH10ACT2_BH10ACT2_02510 [soil metagenome]
MLEPSGYDAAMVVPGRAVAVTLLLFPLAACSGGKAASSEPTVPVASTAIPTICATTPEPEGRVVVVIIDDVVNGYGSLSLRADGNLTPGIVRLEVVGDVDNASPLGVSIVRDGFTVGSIDGVAAGETCGIDLQVSEGIYHITDGDRDVEFTIEP